MPFQFGLLVLRKLGLLVTATFLTPEQLRKPQTSLDQLIVAVALPEKCGKLMPARKALEGLGKRLRGLVRGKARESGFKKAARPQRSCLRAILRSAVNEQTFDGVSSVPIP